MKLSTLTPELRAEAANVATALKAVITAERSASADYFRFIADRPAVASKMVRDAHNPGMTDPAAALIHFDTRAAALLPEGARTRLADACQATHPFQVKVFNFIRAQIDVAVKKAVTPFFTARTLAGLPFTTELEQRVNGLAMRLRLSTAQNFEEALRQAELTCQVLEDFANGREVFHLEPAEVPAAA